MIIHLETPRLILREVTVDDANGFYELDSDPEVHRYLGNKTVTTLQQCHDTISFLQKQYIENGIGRWAVVEKESGEFIGWSGIKLVTETFNNHINYYDLGYRLIRRFWGKGYASESAYATRDYAFEKLGVKELFAAAHTGNVPSNKIILKCGFKPGIPTEYEGEPVNWYSLKQSEWESIR
jgi:ribosomal-protein-alanine N-acetyltransferase